MGLSISVYREANGRDCTLNGISSRFKSLTVVNVDGPFDPQEDSPAVMLVPANLVGCLRLVPAEQVDGQWVPVKSWVMMGGNYGATPDSRFNEACEKLLGHRFYGAVPIHDRIEN